MELKPWQQNIFDKIVSSGVKPGEMMIMSAGRQTGKSAFTAQAIDRLMQDLNSRPIEELVLGQSTYMGTRYYTVAPVGGNWLEMETWCIATFGDRSNVWDITTLEEQLTWRERGRWYANDRRFWFRTEKDRDWFILRWSGA